MRAVSRTATEILSLQTELASLSHDALELEQKVTQAFELLRGPVHRYLVAVLGNPAEAEELTQETFLRLYRHLHSGQSLENVRAWVFRVAHNLAIDRQRTNQNPALGSPICRTELHGLRRDLGPSPEERVLDQERLERIHAGLVQLSPQERQCLDLRAEGLRYREIAQTLGISGSSVAEFLRRAIHKLMREINV